ncbi:MAG TPA: glycoside hydrolase family 44 protein [Polyangiaceae bacterium]|nr:glycoside hydrolase family 44 protein [Polyangiaceae bacterium]
MSSALSVYDGKLSQGWSDWGWGKHDLSQGPARVDFSNFGGFIIHHEAALSERFGSFSFHMRAPSSFGDFLQVQVAASNDDVSRPPVDVVGSQLQPLPDGWVGVSIPWQVLNPSGAPIDRIVLHAKVLVPNDWVSFDKLALTPSRPDVGAPTATGAMPVTAAKHVRLVADCQAPGHPISPYIYGVVGDEPGLSATARRWGGNPTSRYNWQLGNAYNAGSDWFFQNTKSDDYRTFLKSNQSRHIISAVTVPTIGWVAKDLTSYGFPVAIYGAQRAHDPNRVDSGDGVRQNGVPIEPKSPTLTSVPAPPEMMRKWVETIVAEDRKSNARSVKMYILDNEPSLWNSTHRDVHPEPLSYDELLDRTLRYATAIRAGDPQALIAGPAEWGWTGYFFSARDVVAGVAQKPDRRAHGDVPLIPWYLRKLHEHDQASGTRSLDVLDVHYYPQGKNVYGTATDAEAAALRIRSTRSLWDPSYRDESWINDNVRLIPRLKEWVKLGYPGLAVSIGEYNFGGELHISGALALAEVLGRFGTTELDYAFYWHAPPKDSPAYWAFRAYRNFDGKDGHFLERSVDTRMTDKVSLFASRDDSGKHMVLIALNLDPTEAVTADIDLPGCGKLVAQRKFLYGASSQSLQEERSQSAAAMQETLPPYSISVLDVRLE